MRKVLFALAFIVAALGLARAGSEDRPGRDWIPVSAVSDKLREMGFTDILKIEADDGVWKAKASKGGEYYKVEFDPHTGRVIEQYRKHPHADRHKDHDDD